MTLAAGEAGGLFSFGQRAQQVPVRGQIGKIQRVQDGQDIDIAFFRSLAASVTALQADKKKPCAKAFAEDAHRLGHP